MFFYALFGLLIALPRRTVVTVIGTLFCVLIAIRCSGRRCPIRSQSWFNPLIIEFVFGMADRARLSRRRAHSRLGGAHARRRPGLAVFAWSWSQAHFFDPDSVLRVFVWGLPALAIVGAFALSEKPVTAEPVLARLRIPRRRVLLALSRAHAGGRRAGDRARPLHRIRQARRGSISRLIMLAAIVPPLLVHVYLEKPLTESLQRKIEGRKRPQAAAVASPATAP